MGMGLDRYSGLGLALSNRRRHGLVTQRQAAVQALVVNFDAPRLTRCKQGRLDAAISCVSSVSSAHLHDFQQRPHQVSVISVFLI
jgi:hypothetical protein